MTICLAGKQAVMFGFCLTALFPERAALVTPLPAVYGTSY